VRDSLRVVLYVAALAVVLVAAYGVGTRFDPVDPAPAPAHGSGTGGGDASHDEHGGDR